MECKAKALLFRGLSADFIVIIHFRCLHLRIGKADHLQIFKLCQGEGCKLLGNF